VQQRDAFAKVARSLNGEFEALVQTAIARDRYALGSLLAFLEACVKNRSKAAPVVTANGAGPWRRGAP
jgi:hypothetical protein